MTRVRVNGRDARPVVSNYAEWEITLDQPAGEQLPLTAGAEDRAGNIEKTPHRLTVILHD